MKRIFALFIVLCFMFFTSAVTFAGYSSGGRSSFSSGGSRSSFSSSSGSKSSFSSSSSGSKSSFSSKPSSSTSSSGSKSSFSSVPSSSSTSKSSTSSSGGSSSFTTSSSGKSGSQSSFASAPKQTVSPPKSPSSSTTNTYSYSTPNTWSPPAYSYKYYSNDSSFTNFMWYLLLINTLNSDDQAEASKALRDSKEDPKYAENLAKLEKEAIDNPELKQQLDNYKAIEGQLTAAPSAEANKSECFIGALQ